MIKTHKVIGAIILALLMEACSDYDSSTSISDVRREQLVVLKSGDPKPVHSINIQGKGHIEGEATISLMLNGKPYKTEKLNGATSFKWAGDWYSDTAEIQYRPTHVSSGELVLEYRFYTL